jgi:hypothetical protein
MKGRMGGSLGSLTEVNKDPAGAASGLMAALSEFMEPEQAAKLALSVHEGELDRLSAEARAAAALAARKGRGTGTKPGTPTKMDIAFEDKADAAVRDVRNNIQQMEGFRGMNESAQAADKLLASADLKTGVADTNAVKQMIRATEDRISDSDMRIALQSGGLWSQLMQLKGYVGDGGKRDENYMRQVADVARAMRSVIRSKQQEAGERAHQIVMEHPRTDIWGEKRQAWAEHARRQVAGGYGGPGPGSAHGKGADDAELEDALK